MHHVMAMKHWLVQKQTVFDKDKSILFMVDSLPKTVWLQRSIQFGTHTSYKGNATSSGGNNTGGQTRVVKCYNCQGEGHMARQCTQPKRPRNTAWFKKKAMLAEAQELVKFGYEEQTSISCRIRQFQTVKLAQNNHFQNICAFQTEDLELMILL
ncbi:retrotransposon protein, putative, unclassified [Tanacetum coccineum]|uniref:Retrotransposon protein, putative, unclassified n=1 Tax=Tanacetum coccineum TaxID=301880 RepID=A0ABQ4X3Z5_9ASTR